MYLSHNEKKIQLKKCKKKFLNKNTTYKQSYPTRAAL